MSGVRRFLLVPLVALLFVPFAPPALAGQASTFHWGVATAGFQAEGSAPDSNWSRYAAANAGHGGVDPYGEGVDFRHRYPQDIRRAASMGVNTFRFSVEWARVQPRPGVWDARELAYYDDVVRRVRAAGMTPMITLNHWVYPGWVEDGGGFAAERTVDEFLAFSAKIVHRYRDRHVLWVTFNEPTAFLTKELQIGALSPPRIGAFREHIVTAHRRAYDMIHRIDPTGMVTSNQAYTALFNPATDLFVMDRIADKLDYIGLDYYYGASLDNLSAVNAASGQLWKVRLEPEGIYDALRYYAHRYPDLPLYVVENGMPTDDGKPRADGYTRSDALRDTVFWLQRAKADGMDVIGYNYWSITDNYEWGSYRPRFGLYTVDARTDPTLTRKPTDAVATYRDIISRGGVPHDYHLVTPPSFCSLDDPPASCLVPADADGPLAGLNQPVPARSR